ncbi:hypothetical protein P691DRAFT_773098 [Macrolepiota fuliginosa MF-IS2]|uniref:Uncharacterized protein n=1 Tax=Macrolepiota fuliginosa MF-IS2 TaxID=1400762 RepID=A0A9P5XHD7_9AGAR|nr:hypothetical protein P691DRAFT_773098 [Macrolepiota fuliginosa MF-IS2]
MNSTPGTHIPQEIFNLIIEELRDDLHAIRSLCLVSRALCTEAQRYLYSRIRITSPRVFKSSRDFQTLDTRRSILFLTTIAYLNHTLGRFVQEFHYSPENGSRPDEFWLLVNQSLYYMINLRVFTFRNFVSPSTRALFWGTKFQLEEFYWDDGYTTDKDGELLWFLRTQFKLKLLAAPLSKANLRSALLPELQTFIGDAESIKQVVPHHPVTKLRWKGPDMPSAAPRITLAALAPLQTLSIGCPRAMPWLNVIAPYVKSLQVLHITGTRDSNEISFEFDHIASLTNLRVFVWSPLPWARGFYERTKQERFVVDWFKKMKKLEAVYFYIRNGETGEDGFLQWAPGERVPMQVTLQELVKRESLQEFAYLLDGSSSFPNF